MNSYAMYRIAETIRLLLFMTASILIFNFYPVTAIMVVLLALLNDLPIMMIAYDNAPFALRPVRWDMARVLTIASVLGILGVFASFGMFWIARDYLGLAPELVQSVVFLKLLVAGHMTIYLTRNKGPIWEHPLAELETDCPLRSDANRRHAGGGLWLVHDADRLGIGAHGLGLCPRVFHDRERGQDRHLSAAGISSVAPRSAISRASKATSRPDCRENKQHLLASGAAMAPKPSVKSSEFSLTSVPAFWPMAMAASLAERAPSFTPKISNSSRKRSRSTTSCGPSSRRRTRCGSICAR